MSDYAVATDVAAGVDGTDTIVPVIIAPTEVSVPATGAGGATVDFNTSALDNVDGPIATVNTPASGTLFPTGTTPVTTTATNAAGNTAELVWLVTVLPLPPAPWTVSQIGSGTAGTSGTVSYDLRSGAFTFQGRGGGNVSTARAAGRGIPQWIRLLRSNSTTRSFFSADDLTWTQVGSTVTNTLASTNVRVGLAVAPRSGSNPAAVVLDNVTFFSPRQTWREDQFGSADNVGNAADFADSHADDYSNLLKYAIDTRPVDASSGRLATPHRQPSHGSDFSPRSLRHHLHRRNF